VGNVVLGVVTFPLFAAMLYAFGVPNYLLIGGVAAVLNLMPFAGAILAGFFPAVALYAATQSVFGPLLLYGICFVIHLVAADVITPKVLGSHVNINATTSTIAMVVWGEIWGGIGLIIAIPLMSIIKILFEHSEFDFLHWLAGLMSPHADEALEMAPHSSAVATES
jgi:predicted PurR-regulated permease PerM